MTDNHQFNYFVILVLILIVGLGLALALPWLANQQGLAAQSSEVALQDNAPAATRYYVALTGTGTTGTSWATAFKNVQNALAVAVDPAEIWVAKGVYYPDVGDGQINDSVTATFLMTDGVSIFGGFNFGDSDISDRDWENNLTVLSGDIDHETNPDATDPHGVVTDTANIAGNNAYHVVYSDNVTGTALVDGFFITAGQANGSWPDHRGGGMYNRWHSAPTISNVIFFGNSATDGGGMYNDQSNPTLTNVTFSANSATDGGGMSGDGNPALTDVTFSGNTAYRGGGMRISFGDPTLTNVTFSSNSATKAGGGMHTSGSQFMLTNGIFSGNSSQWGGGMYNIWSNFMLTNVTFSDNSAFFDGGGIRNYNCDPTLTNVNFSGNSAGWRGGGMDSHFYSEPSLTNVTFSGNSAGQHGGGMYNSSGGDTTYYGDTTLTNVVFSGNLSSFTGGGMYNAHNNPALTNVTFSGNSADYGGGMSNWHNSSPTLTNTILWGNTASYGNQIYNYDSSTPVISYSDIQNSDDSGSWDSALGTDGGNNIDTNPLFILDIDPSTAPTTTGNLRLSTCSPAVNAGNNIFAGVPTDLEGNERIIGCCVDMGAYETMGDCRQNFEPLIFR